MASDPASYATISENHTDNGPAILGVALASTIAAVSCVFLRLYIRTRITRSFWWDDGLIILALALTITGTVFNSLSFNSGAGKHTYDLPNPLTQIPDVIKWNTAYQIDNVICVNMTKLSILLFVLRIPNSKRLAYLIYLVMFCMSVVNIVTVAALASQCRPLKKLWKPTIPGDCFYEGELSRFGYAQGVMNVLTDFFCSITPVFILWNVKIERRLKFAICGLMSIGLVATASQIVRVVALKSLDAEDYTYQITTIVVAAILDQNLGIIAACIPTFQPLFRSLTKKLRSIRSRSTSRKRGYPISSLHQSPLEPEYGKQGLTHGNKQSINAADDLAARNSGESGFPLNSLTTVERNQY